MVREAGWEIAHDGMEFDAVNESPCRERLLPESNSWRGFHAIGEERYHHKHPFHLLMHEGKLTRGQLQAWALNRYYYQSRIPMKDAMILARSEDADISPRVAKAHLRSRWRRHASRRHREMAAAGGSDGADARTGTARRRDLTGDALRRGRLCGIRSLRHVSRSRGFVAYGTFFRQADRAAHGRTPEILSVAFRRARLFSGRLTQAPEDAAFALAWVVKHARTREEQEQALGALRAKCNILWAQLDAHLFCLRVDPVGRRPGAFRPECGLKHEASNCMRGPGSRRDAV